VSLEHKRESLDNQKAQSAHQVVQLMRGAGYEYESIQTHRDEEERLHFSRQLGNHYYPHFHLIINVDNQSLNIHVDKGRHKASYLETELPSEMSRLRDFFNIHSHNADGKSAQISEFINKHLTAIALFGNETDPHKERRRQNLFRGVGFYKDGKTRSKRLSKGKRFKL
jgi:hypothetical protein